MFENIGEIGLGARRLERGMIPSATVFPCGGPHTKSTDRKGNSRSNTQSVVCVHLGIRRGFSVNVPDGR